MNSGWTRAVIALLSLFVIMIFVGQVFFSSGVKLTTETALRYDYDEEIPFDGVYMRDEVPVYSTGTGVLSYEREDGSKVGKSSVIARRYRSENDVTYRRRIEELTRQLEVLAGAEKLIGTDNSQLEAISAQINESHSQIISSLLDGKYSEADDESSSLLEAMCKREITLKESDGYSAKKAELNSEISRLNALLSGEVYDITADGTGYFVSSLDGYEDKISFSDIDSMTEDFINEVVKNPARGSAQNSGSAVGKLVADYHWRAAAVIETENLFGVYVGSDATLRVGSDPQLLQAQIVSVTPCGKNKAIYVFECDKLTSSVVTGRTAKFKLLVNSYGGLRVSRKALRYDAEGNRGVFIVRGGSLYFKKVNVVYWGEDYVICSQESGDDYLMLYDEIVTEGKDLYDGKVIG